MFGLLFIIGAMSIGMYEINRYEAVGINIGGRFVVCKQRLARNITRHDFYSLMRFTKAYLRPLIDVLIQRAL